MTKSKSDQATQPRDEPMQRRQTRPVKPVLRFTPTAWAKLLFFRDRQGTEIGGFGVTSPDNPLRVEEFVSVKQDVTVASVAFDDEAVADFFEDQVELGRKPENFARIWLHTHPGQSPTPSGTDEETFHRVFGKCQWAVMFILARGGKTYARLRFNVGPGGESTIPVEVDYSQPFGPSEAEAWQAEFDRNIKGSRRASGPDDLFGSDPEALANCVCPDEWIEELEAMEPDERELILAELSARPDLWNDCEVVDEYE